MIRSFPTKKCRRVVLFSGVFSAIFLLLVSVSDASIVTDGAFDPTFTTTVTEGSGAVFETIVQPDGKIIAVGLFHAANGTRMNGVARFNSDGARDTSFNSGGDGTTVSVYAVALQADGKIIIGGGFTSYNGQAVPRIVRLNSDGSIDSSFASGVSFNGNVRDIAIQPDGKILVGGQFSNSGSRLFRLTASGGVDTAFSGLFSTTVMAILVTPSGKIIAGGDQGFPASAIKRINNDGSIDPTFTPGTGPDSTVYRLVLQPDDKIVASGAFHNYNGVATDGIVRINDNGTLDSAFDHLGATASINEAWGLDLQSDGKIVLGFWYTDNAGQYSRIVRFNANGTVDPNFTQGDPDWNQPFDVNCLSNGKILIGGHFIEYNDQPRLRLVQLNSEGSTDPGFSAAVSFMATVRIIKNLPDGRIMIGGDFEYVNGIRTRGGMARLHADGTLDTSFQLAPGFYGGAYTFAIQPDGKILIGSSYIAIYRVNSNGSVDPTFVLDFQNSGYFVFPARAIGLQSDGKIVMAGSVSGPSGTYTSVRLNPNGGFDAGYTSLRVGTGQVMSMIVQSDDKIVIGGTFLSSSEFPRTGLGRLNANGTLGDGFTNGGTNIFSLAGLTDGKILSGGLLLTRFGSSGVVDNTLNTGSGFDTVIRAVKPQPDGKIVVGGDFTTYNGTTVNRIIRVNTGGSLDNSFNVGSGPSGSITALTQQVDGKILVGGQFLNFNGQPKYSLVRLLNSTTPRRAQFDFDGDGKTDPSVYRPSAGDWYLLNTTTGFRALHFGLPSDIMVPADYTGDGKTDMAVWRPSDSIWYILRSEDNTFYGAGFGAAGDIPAPGDYDGDGKADLVVIRPDPTQSYWYLQQSTAGFAVVPFGLAGDVPTIGDYDGDGKNDVAVYRPSAGAWFRFNSSNGSFLGVGFGIPGDKVVPADYTGDGKTDLAVFRPSNNIWYILRSEDNSLYGGAFGAAGDLPSPGDYDGDGKADLAVYRLGATAGAQSVFYVLQTTAGFNTIPWGLGEDRPVPGAYVY